jgi:hypothetical protein
MKMFFTEKMTYDELQQALKGLGVKLTIKQMGLFNREASYLLTGPTCLYQARLVPSLKNKGLLELDTFTSELETLQMLTPKGRKVALLFSDPKTPQTVANEARNRLEEKMSMKFARHDICSISLKLKNNHALLRWHAVDCFEFQGGTFDTRTICKIKSVRQKIASEKTFDNVPGWPHSMSDSSILDGIVNVKPFVCLWKSRHFHKEKYQGAAKRMREYAIDHWYETVPKDKQKGIYESSLCHWQGMQLIHLCELWTSCGERTPQLLLDGTCPMPARFDE